jgi:hypothetical protein
MSALCQNAEVSIGMIKGKLPPFQSQPRFCGLLDWLPLGSVRLRKACWLPLVSSLTPTYFQSLNTPTRACESSYYAVDADDWDLLQNSGKKREERQ